MDPWPPARKARSVGFTAAAATRTRTWPGPGDGNGSEVRRSTSGPPNSENPTTRIIFVSLLGQDRQQLVHAPHPQVRAARDGQPVVGRRTAQASAHRDG